MTMDLTPYPVILSEAMHRLVRGEAKDLLFPNLTMKFETSNRGS
jgi:hypothetical protein